MEYIELKFQLKFIPITGTDPQSFPFPSKTSFSQPQFVKQQHTKSIIIECQCRSKLFWKLSIFDKRKDGKSLKKKKHILNQSQTLHKQWEKMPNTS